MMKKKRKKSSRMRGSHTHGTGFMKKARGSGHRGGKGMSGTGKRADHRKTLILKKGIKYFGKEGLKPKQKNYIAINVSDIKKLSKGKNDVNLENYKILGKGEIDFKVNVKVYAITKSAKEKIEKAGGTVTLRNGSEGNN